MKTLCLLVILATIGLGFPSRLPAQATRSPAKLSKMDDAEFAGWLLGTEWELSLDSGVCRAWFVGGELVVLSNKSSDTKQVEECYTGVKGEVSWDAKIGDLADVVLKVNETLTGATVKVGREGQETACRFISRHVPPSVSDMSLLQFKEWLQTHILLGEDGHTVTLNSEGLISIKSPKIVGERQVQPVLVRPGMFQINWEGGGKVWLYIISPDLSTFESYANAGNTKGTVIDAPAKPEKTEKSEVAMSAVGGEIKIDDAAVIPLKKTMASLNSLMVMDLGNSRYAGKASKLSISALKLQSSGPATVKFNQVVGTDMYQALEEVARFHSLRHSGWPQGYRIELAFADKYGKKDGPSAAVACALALESLLGGVELEPAFAVTGDLNADGAVQPIGGVSAKLRGATNSGMRLVAIPEKNRLSTVDLAITEGMAPFLHTQIFSIATFEDALALARADKSPALEQSLAQYALLSEQLRSNPQALRTPANVEILVNIAARTPNHLAARLLLAMAQNKLPSRLSAAGSLEAVDQCVAAIAEGIDSDLSAGSNLDAGKLADASFKLIRLRQTMDLNVLPYADAWINWSRLADLIVSGRGATTQNIALFRVAREKLGAERNKLRGNAAFNEALMK